MQNSMVVFTFFCFRLEILFYGKFSPKNQNFQFKLKFGTYNPGRNILELYSVLEQVPLATSKTWELRKLGNIIKVSN